MIVKLLTEHHLELLSLKRRLQRHVLVYTCQNVKLLEISCRGSNLIVNLPVEQMKKHMSNNLYEAILLYALILKQINIMNSGRTQCTCCTILCICQVTINPLLQYANNQGASAHSDLRLCNSPSGQDIYSYIEFFEKMACLCS